MTEEPCQVIVAGGGMAGISLAHGLHRRLGPDSRLMVVENTPLPPRAPHFEKGSEKGFEKGSEKSPGRGRGKSFERDVEQNYSPSLDARSTALSYGSCLIYRELGLWDRLSERACPIESIHVSTRGRFGSTLMRAADNGWPALGYVIENAWLGNVLNQALLDTTVSVRSPDRVVAARVTGEHVQVELKSGETLATELLVVADGARSGLRESLGIEVSERHYRQRALVTNIVHAEPHRGRAFERFGKSGPLAMLPLPPGPDGAHRSNLVWSLEETGAEALQAAGNREFLARVQESFGYRLGRFLDVGERRAHPLSLVMAREQVRRGIVVMGNAAHSLHPVAGQGFNLALRDIARLVDLLGEAQGKGGCPGDLEVLERYRAEQAADQRQTSRFTDNLPGLFMHGNPALGLLRNLGLALLDISPPLKKEFVRHTAGVAASADYRHVQP